jgi:hypothetical protein
MWAEVSQLTHLTVRTCTYINGDTRVEAMKAAMKKIQREQKEAREKLQDEERRTTTQLRQKNEKASEVLREKRNLAVFALNETQEECVPLAESARRY